MGDLLWWAYGQTQINDDIKEAIAPSESCGRADQREGQEAREKSRTAEREWRPCEGAAKPK